jgi:SAM-dependent methyltransferase
MSLPTAATPTECFGSKKLAKETDSTKDFFAFNQSERYHWVSTQAAITPAGCLVLDVGAGTGRYRSLFSHCAYRAHDFGQEPGTIGKYTALDYESDITAIPVHDSSFDVILCIEVLEHVPEPIRAVQEMARILRSNGKLLLTAPLGSFLHQEPYHFYGGYTPHWYHRFLPEAGLDVVSIEPNRGFFSWFGQEAQRFSTLIDPRRTLHTAWQWPGLTLLWLVTLPFCRMLFPLLGGVLDRLRLEQTATVGYHVVAVKQSMRSGA